MAIVELRPANPAASAIHNAGKYVTKNTASMKVANGFTARF